jgi:hypothetical protein
MMGVGVLIGCDNPNCPILVGGHKRVGVTLQKLSSFITRV